MNKSIKLPKLPPENVNLESVKVLKKLISANSAISELKGVAKSIPNRRILINSLILQEAKESSEIENIITTHDELFRADIGDTHINQSTKEVTNYRHALNIGFNLIQQDKMLITRHILEIHKLLEGHNSGLRKLPGTSLKNSLTNEVIYTPPQDNDSIKDLLDNLVTYINDDTNDDIDPLVKMAVIHYQFESIHPFYDGNGRTGRIINILYLVLKGLLDIPILYLSRYIIKNKAKYYKLLQDVRDNNNWEDWLLYMIEGVRETSLETIELINLIKELMFYFKNKLKNELPRIYSKELLDILFLHPYTKIDFITKHLNVSRQTASSHLNSLVKLELLSKVKLGRSNYYINIPLCELFKGK